MKKAFLISIDTEGDNQWAWEPGKAIKTENARYLPRFQTLCETYGFFPTYLTNYEMAGDTFFSDYFGKKQQDGQCEIGMHLHAWNCPPNYTLPVRTDQRPGAPYLIEYPVNIMEEKIVVMTNLLKERFGVSPVTHRAGRWAMNQDYYRLLAQYGFKTDCSVTPGINWQKACGQSPQSCGSDYTNSPVHPYYVDDTGILEIPMTIRENHCIAQNPGEGMKKWLRNHYRAWKGTGKIWLRPNGANLIDMLYLAETIYQSKTDDYLMFMIHSSELMPGGKGASTSDSIEKIYKDIEKLFQYIAGRFEGERFCDFKQRYNQRGN